MASMVFLPQPQSKRLPGPAGKDFHQSVHVVVCRVSVGTGRFSPPPSRTRTRSSKDTRELKTKDVFVSTLKSKISLLGIIHVIL